MRHKHHDRRAEFKIQLAYRFKNRIGMEERMNLVFVSNYINHHQIPVSDRLYELCKEAGGNYFFVQTEEMEAQRVAMGWQDEKEKLPYLMEYQRDRQKCQEVIDQADVVIFGGTEDRTYITRRLKEKKPILFYTESVYKTGRYKFVSPRGFLDKVKKHTRYLFSPVYLLCAGAYVAGDFRLFGAYLGKKYRYGYFPKRVENPEEKRDYSGKLEFLWAGRMIGWKQPELALGLAGFLKKKGYDFRLTMIGDGELRSKLEEIITREDLQEVVQLTGFVTPEETKEYMKSSHIFLGTSNREEGWGAVLNEAMSAGCVVVANRQMGAAPYLLQHGKNGLLFEKSGLEDLCQKVEELIKHPQAMEAISGQAKESIDLLWNERVAADRLFAFAACLKDGKRFPKYESGPLSKI